MTTYNWIISSMSTRPKEGTLTDVVFLINWRRGATTLVNEREYYIDVIGEMTCSQPSTSDFTPYDQLTYEQVCGWLDAGTPVTEIDAKLDLLLENMINPTEQTLPLPFTNP